jgi:hypothetical protein
MHHIVSDGWSSAILVRELTSLYEAFSAGQRSPLPGLPVQYADFAVWQRRWLQGEALEAQVDYWSQKLQGLPALSLPIDRPRPKARTTEGARQTRMLPGSLCARLNDLSSSENVTIFMLLLAAFKSLLHYYTRQTDIVVGTDVAGRNSEETERLIGFFVNQIVLRCDLSGDPSFRQLVARVREMALEAYAYQELPFDKLVEEINPERDMSMTPLFQVKFVHQNVPLPTLQQSDLSLEIIGSEGTPAKFDLLLEVIESGDRLTCVLDYSTQLFEAETISRMLQQYDSLLTMIAERPDARLQEIVEVLARADLVHTAANEEALEQATVQSLRSARRKPLSLSQP